MPKIFIIEDDVTLRGEISKLLNNYGYKCSYSDDFENIVEETLKTNPNLILLDINLPYYDGYHVCREIRKRSAVPIIVVTSRNSDMDELMSMNLGADDFITKPYNTQILLAHISAVLKRAEPNIDNQIIECNNVVLNISKSLVSFEEKETELTKNELGILTILMKNKGCIVHRNDIMNELWQSDEFIDDNTLTVNVNRLRKKLENIGAKGFIETKRGQGYMI
ncbi:response regulator transcription factor [Clostridium ganghwense]|uniref:Stage 0 sporulation protein A homolog n=1 Tax=Clostridium ganghwense TaxID=312089 RepID=A0ABT4CK15_9CLOT|nr:response regulator transcription factor [Clostridium ganghwense]MCY6369390.1 response regulator transcription factor [Clostridium ganghwense]